MLYIPVEHLHLVICQNLLIRLLLLHILKVLHNKILIGKILFSIIFDSYECQDSQLVDLGISSSLQLRGNIIYYYV